MFDTWFREKVSKHVIKMGANIKIGLSRDKSMIRKLLGINAPKMAKMCRNVEALKKSSRFLFLYDLTAKQMLRLLSRSIAGRKHGISFVNDFFRRARTFGWVYIDKISMFMVVFLNTAVRPFMLEALASIFSNSS